MAAKKKKVTKKSVSAAKKTPAGRERAEEDFSVSIEIGIIVLLFISILLFLSNFGLIGRAGSLFSGVFKGLFGIMAYPFPVILFFGSALYIANRAHRRAAQVLAGGILVFLSLCALFQLIFGDYRAGTPVADYYRAYRNGGIAGGFFGGILISLFASVFGKVGAWLLSILLLLVGAVLFSGKPLLTLIGQRSGSAIRNAGAARRDRAAMREREDDVGPRPVKKKRTAALVPDEDDVDDWDEPAPARRGKSGSILPWDPVAPVKKEEIPISNYADQDPVTERPVRSAAGNVTEEPEEGTLQEKRTRGKAVVSHKSLKTGDKKTSAEEKAEKDDVEALIDLRKGIPSGTEYVLPPTDLLSKMDIPKGDSKEHMKETAEKLERIMADFGVQVKVTKVSRGPTVTQYEVEPEHGVKVSKIVSLTDDIKLGLAAADIRIEAPIPGKAAVGIEVPNLENSVVPLRDMLEEQAFRNFPSRLAFAVGRDLGGNAVIADIKKMPHLLIAGATNSGKSVCINTLIMSILFKAKPDEVKMILIDPKVIELSVYNGIPHLLLPVVTDPKKAAGALGWAVSEMERRYRAFADIGVGIRDLASYNMHIRRKKNDPAVPEEEKAPLTEMPQILVIVDELADLMMVAPGEVEQSICRLTQLARAAGIHLIVATQRPSVNVITGLIKANMPSRIAFAVASGVDSRTILDMNGAERLLGKGDMLYSPQGYPKPARLQGTFVSDEDVQKVTNYLKERYGENKYDESLQGEIEKGAPAAAADGEGSDDRDEYFFEAGRFIIDKDKASIGMLQRNFRIGFNRAARIMDQLAEAGVVGPEEGTKPRQILMSIDQFDALEYGETEDD